MDAKNEVSKARKVQLQDDLGEPGARAHALSPVASVSPAHNAANDFLFGGLVVIWPSQESASGHGPARIDLPAQYITLPSAQRTP